MSRIFFFAPLAALAACGTPQGLDGQSVAEAAANDLESTLTGLGLTREAVYRAELDRSTAPAPTCSTTTDQCTWCTEWEGRTTEGHLVSSPLAAPCAGNDASHLVVDGWLDGDWSRPRDAWQVRASGQRDLRLATPAGVIDSYATLASLDASWTDLGLQDWSTVLHYEGTGDQRWTVDVSGLGHTFVGTLSANTGERCTVYGTLAGEVRARCDGSR